MANKQQTLDENEFPQEQPAPDVQSEFGAQLNDDGTLTWQPAKEDGFSGTKYMFRKPTARDISKLRIPDSLNADGDSLPFAKDLSVFDTFLTNNNYCNPAMDLDKIEPMELILARRVMWAFLCNPRRKGA